MKIPLYILAAVLVLAVTRENSLRADDVSQELLQDYADSSKLHRPIYQFRGPYFQRQKDPISFDRPITCVYQTYSSAGYIKKEILKEDSELLERVQITPDEAPNVWKITLHDKTADLIITGGGWENIKNETWTVISKTTEYLILACVTSDPATIRTITINAQYGTFVQCFNGHQPWAGANLGTVSWGYCTNQ
jgi:hypothetical protein